MPLSDSAPATTNHNSYYDQPPLLLLTLGHSLTWRHRIPLEKELHPSVGLHRHLRLLLQRRTLVNTRIIHILLLPTMISHRVIARDFHREDIACDRHDLHLEHR